MALTAALYYPWIDIRDIGWLKKTALYWNDIHTIVPYNYGNPYSSREANLLHEEGILRELYVTPDTKEVELASAEFQQYLNTNEARSLLNSNTSRSNVFIGKNPLTPFTASIHDQKISRELRDFLFETGAFHHSGEWVQAEGAILNYYMSLLAGHISSERSLGLLADDRLYEPLSTRVARGDNPDIHRIDEDEIRSALFAKIIIPINSVIPETPIEDILNFRRKYADELALFRMKIEELTVELNKEYPSEQAFRQSVKDIYINEIRPAQNRISRAMSGLGMHHFKEGVVATIFCAPGFVLAEQTFQPWSGIYSPLIAVGLAGLVIAAAKRMDYEKDREENLSENPFSYVYYAGKSFRRRWKLF